MPMSFDESYYWVWSHNLQLSYFDHPPIIAILFWLGHFLEPFGQAVRWPAILMGHLSAYIWVLIMKKHLSSDRLWWFALVILINPLVGWGSIIVTPDLPLLFFSSFAFYYFQKILESGELADYAYLGVASGLAFSSKYHAFLLIPACLVCAFLLRKKSRISPKGFALTILLGLVFSSPPIVWNIMNDFISFRFQMSHGFGGNDFHLSWSTEYLSGQVALLFPVLLLYAFKKFDWNLRSTFLVFATTPLIFFFMSSLRARSEANWPILAYPFVYALAVKGAPSLLWIKRICYFWSLALIVILTDLVWVWIPLDSKTIKTHEFYEFAHLVTVAKTFDPIFASSFQMASNLTYLTKKPIPKLRGLNRIDFYDFVPQSVPSEDKFYLIFDVTNNLPWGRLRNFKLVRRHDVFEDYMLLEFQKK